MSKERVIAYGEVFTPQHIVEEMCDGLPQECFENPRCRFLEPSCGGGVFLLEILKRKLQYCTQRHRAKSTYPSDDNSRQFLYDVASVVSSIYGIDIQSDNVETGQLCMIDYLQGVIQSSGCDPRTAAIFRARVEDVIRKNVVQGDTLTGTNQQQLPIVCYQWKYFGNGVVEVYSCHYRDIAERTLGYWDAVTTYRFWDDV